jgi:hypothetical protein
MNLLVSRIMKASGSNMVGSQAAASAACWRSHWQAKGKGGAERAFSFALPSKSIMMKPRRGAAPLEAADQSCTRRLEADIGVPATISWNQR